VIQSKRRLRVYCRGRKNGWIGNEGGGWWYRSVEAVKVTFEDALAHRGRGPARPALCGTEGSGAAWLAVAAKGEAALCGADGRVRWSVRRGTLPIIGTHEGGAAKRESAQEALAALVVCIGESGILWLSSEAPGNNSARATSM